MGLGSLFTYLPLGKNPVGCKWVFTVNHRADGSIERFKARLVAKGYTWTYGIDKNFCTCCQDEWIQWEFCYLVLILDEIYNKLMSKCLSIWRIRGRSLYENPYWLLLSENGRKGICQLRKAFFGLKQWLRAWFDRFSATMITLGDNQSNASHSIYQTCRQ